MLIKPMYPRQYFWLTLQRIASMAMVLCFVYQLGACPCGCLEHNAWLEMLGLGSHPHDHVAANDRGTTIFSAEDHDCTGQTRPSFLNNARLIDGPDQNTELVVSLSDVANPHDAICQQSTWQSRRGPPRVIANRSSQPALQVFRL